MMRRRRRPLLRTAALAGGGAALYHAGKTHEANADHEADAGRGDPAERAAAGPGDAGRAGARRRAAGLSDDAMARLKELGQLHEQGVLTDEEFAARRTRSSGADDGRRAKMEEFGPVQIMVVGFRETNFQGRCSPSSSGSRSSTSSGWSTSWWSRRTTDGEIVGVELSDLSPEESAELGAIAGALVGLGMDGEEGAEAGALAGAEAAEDGILGEEEMWSIADAIPLGHDGRGGAHRAPLGHPAARRDPRGRRRPARRQLDPPGGSGRTRCRHGRLVTSPTVRTGTRALQRGRIRRSPRRTEQADAERGGPLEEPAVTWPSGVRRDRRRAGGRPRAVLPQGRRLRPRATCSPRCPPRLGSTAHLRGGRSRVVALSGISVGLSIHYLPGTGGQAPSDGFKPSGPVPPAEIAGIVLAAFATLSLGVVLGTEAPLIALGSGIGVLTMRLIKRDAPEMAVMVIAAAGSFAAVSALLGSPILGAFLMMEAAGIGGAMWGSCWCRDCSRRAWARSSSSASAIGRGSARSRWRSPTSRRSRRPRR